MTDRPESHSSDDVITEFLCVYRQDREEGVTRPLREYLDRWPGDEVAVADAWVAREKARGGVGGPLTLRQNWVGPYRTIKLIGRGGQGEVFLAEDSRLRRKVALKVLTAIGPLSDELHVRFRREAELASKLEHPHLCRVYDTGVETGIPYIAMQFVEGEPLSETITRARERGAAAISLPSTDDQGGPPRRDLMRVVEFFEKVARALQAAHDRNVIHRDIKPGNLMLTPDAEPVVLDFGVARDLDSPAHTLTQSGELFGSPAYMAPEQLSQKRLKIDRRTDVYSLGVTLFECLTLHRPFEAPTLEALCQAITTKNPPDATALNPQIPRDLRVVLETALEKNRDHRYRRALEFAEDLRRVRQMRPIHAKAPGAVVRFERWVQRNPVATSFTAALLVVLGVGLVGALVLLDRLRTEAAGKATALETAKTALSSREKLIEEMERLADVQRLRGLARWDARLWPVHAASVEGDDGMGAWVHEARALHDRLPLHRTTLAAIDAAGGGATLTWRAETLREIVAAASELPARITAMQRRIELARRLGAPPTGAGIQAWRETTAAVAEDPRYRGLAIARHRELVPIGRDPVSGLFEFAHAGSGQVPERGDDGRLSVAVDRAIVLVLIPGRAPLPAFFIAKHDLSQAQWRSVFPFAQDEAVTEARTREAVRRLGLALPSQAQWEAASLALGASFGDARDGVGVRPTRGVDPAASPPGEAATR